MAETSLSARSDLTLTEATCKCEKSLKGKGVSYRCQKALKGDKTNLEVLDRSYLQVPEAT